MLVVLVVLVVAFFSVNLPEIGGITHLAAALPERHFRFDTDCSFAIVWLWIGWNLVNNTVTGFLLVCMAIPNPLSGRLAFLFVGGVLFALGLLLWTLYQRKAARAAKTRKSSL